MRDFYDALRILTNFANKKDACEKMNGALELASAELRFETHADAGDHEELSTTAVAEKRDVSTMKTVAELMISANYGDRRNAYTQSFSRLRSFADTECQPPTPSTI